MKNTSSEFYSIGADTMPNKPQAKLMFIPGFGNNFKTIREQNNLTQQELAECFHFDDNIISMIEQERRQPTIEQLNLYVEKFGVSYDYLIGRTKVSYADDQMIHDSTGLSQPALDALIAWEKEVPYFGGQKPYFEIFNELLANGELYKLLELLASVQYTSKKAVTEIHKFKETYPELDTAQGTIYTTDHTIPDALDTIKLQRYLASEWLTRILDKYDETQQ